MPDAAEDSENEGHPPFVVEVPAAGVEAARALQGRQQQQTLRWRRHSQRLQQQMAQEFNALYLLYWGRAVIDYRLRSQAEAERLVLTPSAKPL